MAQQTHSLTRSNLDTATCVSPQGHESSPKNDFSLSGERVNRNLRILARLREIHGLNKPKGQRKFNALNYVCTEDHCIEQNGL